VDFVNFVRFLPPLNNPPKISLRGGRIRINKYVINNNRGVVKGGVDFVDFVDCGLWGRFPYPIPNRQVQRGDGLGELGAQRIGLRRRFLTGVGVG